MTHKDCQHFDGWETYDSRWDFTGGFLALISLYISLILLAIYVTYYGHPNDQVTMDFLFFTSIILILTLSIFLPMILYRIIIELRLIHGTYGKEIAFSNIDHLDGKVSSAIEGTGHHFGTTYGEDDIYHSAVPKFLRMFSKVIEVAGTDLRIVLMGPHDGWGWVFVGPMTTEHPEILEAIVKAIDGLTGPPRVG